MYAVTIARDADEAAVHAALVRVGRPWRPPYDIPRLLFVEGGSPEAIEAIEGVVSCQVVDRAPPAESFEVIEPSDAGG